MMPRILFIGGEKGSWEVRGHQIGRVLGGRMTVQPTQADWEWAEIILLVKRAIDRWGAAAAETGKPILWDVLDCWQQPADNAWTHAEHVAAVRQRRAAIPLAGLIGATQAMATAIGGTYIPHHSRPGLTRQPVRRRLETVAYEGTPKYLGSWQPALERACAQLGARFLINPPSLVYADVVVALRGEQWDGWACRQWKSGVKYVNALVAGRPVVTQPSAAFTEIRPMGVTIEDPAHLADAIQRAWRLRDHAYDLSGRRAREFSLDTISQQYRRLVRSLAWRAA